MFGREIRHSFPRGGQPWTEAEERRLLRLFARPKRVWWCGKLRTTPLYYVASVLGRSPCTCMNKLSELRRCEKRRCGAAQ